MNMSDPIETKETPMTITDSPVDNGVNVQALLGAREALSAAPEAAQFTWRASCTWRTGTHSYSTVATSPALAPSTSTAPPMSSTSTTPSASRPRTTAPRRWSSCWSA